MGKAQYKTKQMSEILNFLQQMEGTHVTVADICDYFKKKGIAVGMTTVYRQSVSYTHLTLPTILRV